MTTRAIFSSPAFWLGSASLALAIGFGCTSSTSSPAPGGNGGCDGGACADTGAAADAGQDTNAGDAAHDGAPPDALYGACAVQGSFGWPCKLTATGADPADCTDPNYPQCFVGGQGAWCTKTCAGAADCTSGASDAGCVPTSCNGRGYCK